MVERGVPRTVELLDESTCWALMADHVVGRLVVAVGSQPDIFPVNYIVDDHRIVIRTAEGTKLAASIMGRRVAFEIDHIDAGRHIGWSVVVQGEATESHTLRDVMHDENLDLEPWATGDKLRFIHITPDRISGRRLVPVDATETP